MYRCFSPAVFNGGDLAHERPITLLTCELSSNFEGSKTVLGKKATSPIRPHTGGPSHVHAIHSGTVYIIAQMLQDLATSAVLSLGKQRTGQRVSGNETTY